MDAGQLKQVQGPLKERYRQEPRSALITLRAEGRAAGLSCNVDTGKALVACAGVTLRAVATSIGVELGETRITAEGDLDFRGTLGVSKEVPVGFQSIRLQFDIDTTATDEQAASLLKLTERYCVVLQTLRAAPQVSARINRTGKRG